MRIIGPNCLGVMNPFTGFNATFSLPSAKPGGVAFLGGGGGRYAPNFRMPRSEAGPSGNVIMTGLSFGVSN